jgi:hypothetical protein
MNIDEAFSFLGLQPSAGREEVDASFRQLVMVYHPDKNPDKTEWSHNMMILLNEAHNIAERCISLRQKKHESSSPPPELLRRVQTTFYAARENILEGMHLYYVFNLENIHLRAEGTRRYRYNTARRTIQKGLVQMEKLISHSAPQGKLYNHIRLFQAFGKSFYGSMIITKISAPDGSINYKAYRHYHNGSAILDALIRRQFFPEDFPQRDLTPKSMILCEQELLLVLTTYRQSIWLPETIIKLSLLENLRKLAEFERDITG